MGLEKHSHVRTYYIMYNTQAVLRFARIYLQLYVILLNTFSYAGNNRRNIHGTWYI